MSSGFSIEELRQELGETNDPGPSSVLPLTREKASEDPLSNDKNYSDFRQFLALEQQQAVGNDIPSPIGRKKEHSSSRPRPKPGNYLTHEVKRTDTLAGLALKYRCRVR